MKYLETEHEKRSFVITSVIFVIILLLCFFLGLSYMDPPPENGIAINFDTEDSGGGGGESGSPAVSVPVPQPASQSTPAADEVATQDVADAPVINKEKPQKETPKQTVKPKEETRKIDQAALDAMNSVKNSDNANNNSANNPGDNISKTPGGGGGGDGPNEGPNKGPYKGAGGGGGGTGNYQLAGRKALVKPEPAGCNEAGKVVIDITVDSSGKVIKADTGRGTSASPCLISQAKAAALKTKWDEGSAEKQVGKITYNFTLTDR